MFEESSSKINLTPIREKVIEVWDSMSPEDKEFWYSSDNLMSSVDNYIDLIPYVYSLKEREYIDTIVDIGCSFGPQSFLFHQIGVKYVGFDPSCVCGLCGIEAEGVTFLDACFEEFDIETIKEYFGIDPERTLVLALHVPVFHCNSLSYQSKFISYVLSEFSRIITN